MIATRHSNQRLMGLRAKRVQSIRQEWPDLGRSAFTVVELLVVIVIISALVALILPAIMSGRESARRRQCAVNLQDVGRALLQETELKQQFPAAGYFTAAGKPRHNWVVTILPWIDQKVIYDKWDFDKAFHQKSNLELAQISLPTLTCPDDTSIPSGQGQLSYVVNGGFGWKLPSGCVSTFSEGSDPPSRPLDLNGNGITCQEGDGSPSDEQILLQTGLFFADIWPMRSGVRGHRVETVFDGASHTVMVTENVRAGYDAGSPEHNWATPEPWRSRFFVSGAVCKNFDCSDGNVDYQHANRRSPFLGGINSGLEAADGAAPWPSSYHSGGVNMAFVDGRVKFVAEGIDGLVYASLMSPQGTRIVGPLAQIAVSDGQY